MRTYLEVGGPAGFNSEAHDFSVSTVFIDLIFRPSIHHTGGLSQSRLANEFDTNEDNLCDNEYRLRFLSWTHLMLVNLLVVYCIYFWLTLICELRSKAMRRVFVAWVCCNVWRYHGRSCGSAAKRAKVATSHDLESD